MAHQVGETRTVAEMAQEFEQATGIPILPSQKLKRAINHEANHITWMEKVAWVMVATTYLTFTGLIILFRGKAPKEWLKLGENVTKRAIYRRLIINSDVVKSGKEADKKEVKRPIHKNVAVSID